MSEVDLSKFRRVMTLEELGISTADEDRAIMPSGGEAFGAGSFIGPWQWRICHWFLAPQDKDYVTFNDGLSAEDQIAKPVYRIERGGYYSYYYPHDQYTQALDACEKFELTIGDTDQAAKPTEVLQFFIPADKILSSRVKEIKEAFGEFVSFDVRMLALRRGSDGFSAKNRHAWNFIVLPSMVASAADVLGYKTGGYDLSELLEPGFSPDDEFFTKFCGDLHGDYVDSELYQRRAKLWAELGEEDPRKSAMTGGVTASGKPNKMSTDAAKLSSCLSFIEGKRNKAVWARVTLVPDPNPEQRSKDSGRQYTIAAVTEIFFGEEHARTVAAMEDEDLGKVSGQPPLPENWAKTPASVWIDFLKEHTEVPDDEEATWYATAAEVHTWREYITEA